MGQREERTKGGRYISGRTGSKQVHTLRGEGLRTEEGGEGAEALKTDGFGLEWAVPVQRR